MSISYSAPSYQDKGNNSITVRVTSSKKEEYSRELVFFVFEGVLEALRKKDRPDLYLKDLNSVFLLLTPQKRANENVRRLV